MQPLYTNLKVNNEIELCEISNPECKQMVEKALLQNRISYFIHWNKTSIFSRKRNTCVICVNDMSKDEAEEIIRKICEEGGYSVKFIMKKTQNDYL